MISRLTMSALHITGRAFWIARFAGLVGLMGLVAGCGGGGGDGSSSGGGGGGGNNPPTVTLSTISVAPASGGSSTVAAGLTLQLKATGSYSDGTTKDLTSTVTWSSVDPKTATVAAGLVTGLAAGATTISATSGTVSGTDALTVGPPNLLSVEISPNGPTIAAGQDLQFTLFGKYTDGLARPITGVTWTSSDTSIATIDHTSGKATALNAFGNTSITATTASGPTSTPVQLTVSATIYAYATNFDDNTVSQYQLNLDGSLGPLTGATATVPSNGTQPFSISVERSGEYVYVANWATSTVAQYRIASNGSLTSIGTGTVQVGLFPNSVTVSHENKYAYVASLGNNTIAQFRIGLDGQLIPLATPTIASGTAPAAVVVHPNDQFAYVGNYGANAAEPPAGPGTISQYKIASDGSLSKIGTGSVASGQGPNALTINPAGNFLYVANHGDGSAPGTVQQYSIGNDGSLTSVATTNVGLRPVGIAIDHSGKFLYVANRTDGTISQFTVDSTTGALTPIGAGTVPAGTNTSAVAIDPTGKALYATDRSSSFVYQFKIDSTTGALTAYASPTAASGLHPTAIAIGY
ncbi:MAG: beta-propeller fold lactonase family protein [Proteobacteria bacterium]|nr:beta-propeller fold lactonase family protein [Pseudomonadota bacterium]